MHDPQLKEIAHHLEFHKSEKFKLINGLIYKHDTDQDRFVIPEAMVNTIIKIYHDEIAHCGAEKVVQRDQRTF